VLICYEDVGLLHWLSRIVWGKSRHEQANDVVEVVRLQVAFELFKQQQLPPEQSFLGLIAQQQKPVVAEVKCSKELDIESLAFASFAASFQRSSVQRRPWLNYESARSSAKSW
jgi:hypothetical protein